MARFKIGAMVDSFRLSTYEGVAKAKEIGADGIQVYVVGGDMTPDKLDAEKRQAFKKYVADNGLQISALCGDLGGHGFQRENENEDKISRSKAIVDLAVDLDVKVVTTHIGVVPEDKASPIYQNMLYVCKVLGAYAESKGVTFAIETGPETSARLAAFLDDVNSKGIGVNLDPANLIMITNDDPVKAVYNLRKYIVHTHAKDGVFLKPCDPIKVYDAFAEGGIEGISNEVTYKEVPLGDGQVNWDKYLDALEDIGFKGFLTIEREVGEKPEEDIRKAANFLKSKI